MGAPINAGETLNIPVLQALKQNLTCYENGKYSETAEDSRKSRRLTLLRDGEDCFDFQPGSQPGNLSLQGFLCPFRLHDTYAVDLTLFYEGTIRTEQLSQLNPQGCLLPQQIQAFLGQTLLLFAEPVNQQDDYQGLANDCVAHLLSGFEIPDLETTGRLLGDPIFEYDNGEIDPVQHLRIIVWFNCQAIAPEQLNKVNQRLFYLLYSQHKILYAHHQARYCADQAKQLYSTIDSYVKRFTIDTSVSNFSQTTQISDRLQHLKGYLQHLNDSLTELPPIELKYARYLFELQDHESTIIINAQNYRSQLTKLEMLPENDTGFLKQFLEQAYNQFQQQIQADQRSLAPGRELLQQLIATTRGLVEVVQAELNRLQQQIAEEERDRQEKADRRLQNEIQAIGTGIAAGTIVASSSGLITQQWAWPWSPNHSSYPHPFLGSIIASVFFALIGWGGVKLLQRSSNWNSKR